MDERYEIKGKIGHGGLGAVYRAQDVRMNREVAIKRILTNTDNASIPEEGTRQLIKEAGALASLQHPNIVTIYDVGSDEDGPFVVMELLTGPTLEDLIDKGSFTWPDFRQLAMQTLEALIAAQELHLVHRDLKPSNIMLTWLPSGKFQVKVVDFGLAKLSAKPSLQTIDQSDGVFGSIYFMAPEQFERVPIDLKADLYAIGCVFYYALTGTYPFDGDNAAQVMASHLQHHVEPLQEVREGIPVWACDWVMWHINRKPSDRPASAHESLMLFMNNDEYPNPELSTGIPAVAPEQPKRPRLVIPGSAPVPEIVGDVATSTQSVKTASMPKPLAPPLGSKPSIHAPGQTAKVNGPELAPPQVAPAPQAAPAPHAPEATVPTLAVAKPAPVTMPASTILKRATPTAGPLNPNSVSKPKLTPSAKPKPRPDETEEIHDPSVAATACKRKGHSNAIKIIVATALGLLTVGLSVYFLKKSGENATARVYNEMINQAVVTGATEVKVDKRKLEILLSSAANVAANDNRDAIMMALYLAKSTDGTDVDARITEFATTQEMIPNVRVVIIRDVLRKRNNPAVIETLFKFSRSTDDVSAAVAAIEATRFMATESNFGVFIDIILTAKENQVIKAAEENAVEIISKTKIKTALREKLITAHDSAKSDTLRHTMLRLLGRIGGENALELAGKNLASDKPTDKVAAIVALGTWGDREGYLALIGFLKSATDLGIRKRAFDSAFRYAAESETDVQDNWTILAAQAKIQDEQLTLIRGLVNVKPAPWVYEILQKFATSSPHDEAIELAERAIDKLEDIESVQGDGEDEE
jgi:serine/threonine protein kinase